MIPSSALAKMQDFLLGFPFLLIALVTINYSENLTDENIYLLLCNIKFPSIIPSVSLKTNATGDFIRIFVLK